MWPVCLKFLCQVSLWVLKTWTSCNSVNSRREKQEHHKVLDKQSTDIWMWLSSDVSYLHLTQTQQHRQLQLVSKAAAEPVGTSRNQCVPHWPQGECCPVSPEVRGHILSLYHLQSTHLKLQHLDSWSFSSWWMKLHSESVLYLKVKMKVNDQQSDPSVIMNINKTVSYQTM